MKLGSYLLNQLQEGLVMYPLRSVKVGLVLLSVVSCYWLYSEERPNENDHKRGHLGLIHHPKFPDKSTRSLEEEPSEYMRLDKPTGEEVKTPPLRIINNSTRPMKVRVKAGGRIEEFVGEDGKKHFVRKKEAEILAEKIIPVKDFIEVPKKKFLQGSIRFFGAPNLEEFTLGVVLEPYMLAGLRTIQIDMFECFPGKDGKPVRGSQIYFSYNFTGGADCSMCLESFKKESEVSVLPCAHFFHSACIAQVTKGQDRICPECRAPYTFIFKNKGINKINLNDIINRVLLIKLLERANLDIKED